MNNADASNSEVDPLAAPAAGPADPELVELVAIGQRLVGDGWSFGKEFVAVAAAESKLSGMSVGVVAGTVTLILVCVVSLLFTLNALLIYSVAHALDQNWLVGILVACAVNLGGLVALALYVKRVWSLVGFKRTGALVSSLFAAQDTSMDLSPPGVGSNTSTK